MLTRWDALLINAMGAYLVEAVWHPEERARALAWVVEALPHVSADEPRMVRLAAHARALVAGDDALTRMAAQSALAELLRWRCAELHAQMEGEDA